MLEDGQSLVELLEDTDDGVMLLHILFGLLHGDLGVETPVTNVSENEMQVQEKKADDRVNE